MSTGAAISLTVSHRGETHALSLPSDSTLEDLQDQLQELTGVPSYLQKLLYKGKKPGVAYQPGTILSDAGIKDGSKIQMLSTTSQELDNMHAAENQKQKRERILRERALQPTVKVRNTQTPSSSSSLRYRFHQIVPLPHLPNPSEAADYLRRLSNDSAIRHVMQKHQFSVGVLTELVPHEHPNLLGLNVNAGQEIKLRIRTDNLQGFRPYLEVRRVLCHELTHNVWGDHDNNFKELNSLLNREVALFERSQAEGTHYLSDPNYRYEPSSGELEVEDTVHILGGLPDMRPAPANESAEERRKRILEATLSRLKKEDQVLEDSCGTAGPSQTTNGL